MSAAFFLENHNNCGYIITLGIWHWAISMCACHTIHFKSCVTDRRVGDCKTCHFHPSAWIGLSDIGVKGRGVSSTLCLEIHVTYNNPPSSIWFCSILVCSIWLLSIWFCCFVLFCSILFYYVMLCYIIFDSVLLCCVLFYSVLLYSVLLILYIA